MSDQKNSGGDEKPPQPWRILAKLNGIDALKTSLFIQADHFRSPAVWKAKPPEQRQGNEGLAQRLPGPREERDRVDPVVGIYLPLFVLVASQLIMSFVPGSLWVRGIVLFVLILAWIIWFRVAKAKSNEFLDRKLASYSLPAHVLAARPYVALTLTSGEGGPNGDYLNGNVRNTNGTAVNVSLVLPSFEIQWFDVLEAGTPQTLRLRWDKFDAERFAGPVSVDFTDTFGNHFRQESSVGTPTLPNGVAHGYRLQPLGPPKLIELARS